MERIQELEAALREQNVIIKSMAEFMGPAKYAEWLSGRLLETSKRREQGEDVPHHIEVSKVQ